MKKFHLLLLLFFALKSFSQKEANIWYFGELAGLDFNTNPPTALTDGKIDTYEGCSSFSDEDGKLLFYSDGITVWDKNHNIMKYEDGSFADDLKGDPSSTQSGMIIPKPGSISIYYLFTVDDGPDRDRFGNIIENGKGLNVFTIDMSLDGGIGQLIDENSDGAFYEDLSDGKFNNWEEKVAAVKGATCNTYWVVSAVDNQFYSYLVDVTGINTVPSISAVPNTAERRGYLKISPDGTKLAITNQSDDFGNSAILYDFNNATGQVSSSEIKLIDGIVGGLGEAYGVEFSSDSQKLYLSTTSGGRSRLANPAVTYKLFQFDLTATDIPGSRKLIHTQVPGSIDYPEGGYRGALQLGPDGKIYATIPLAYANGFATSLDVIENPTANAADIVFTKNAINLNGKLSTQGLPPFIASLLLPIKISDDDTGLQTNNTDLKTCIGSVKVIKPEAILGINDLNYIWTFVSGTVETQISNSSTQTSLNLTNIQLTNKGTYKLKIEGKDDCGNPVEYNASFNLEVFEAPRAKPIPEPIYECVLDATVPTFFDFRKSSLSDKSKEILDGLDDTIFEVLYFDDPLKAKNNVAGTNLPEDYEVNTPSSQTIYARVHNKLAPDTCSEITSFTLTVSGLPVAVDPGPYRACDTDISGPNFGYHDAFLLNTKDEAILGGPGGLDPLLYNISYHTTALGARTPDVSTIIPKDIPYRNVAINNEEIFVRLENKADPTCFDASMSFFLIVDPLPIIKENPTFLEQCITTSDLKPTVNLTLSEVNISSTPNLTFEYYNDPTGATLIATPTSYPVIANTSQSVYVKVISDQGCSKDLVTLTINVGQTPDNPFNALQPPVCDDFIPLVSNDKDNSTIFRLDENAIKNEIKLGITNPKNTEVFFYESVSDRNIDTNDTRIDNLTNYRNDPLNSDNITNVDGGIKFPIYYKILSTINNDCQGLGQFYLQVNGVPIANTPDNFELCDEGAGTNSFDGINTGINLRDPDRVKTILGSTQTELTHEVTFHTSQADADDVTSMGIPNDTNYTNTPQAGWSRGDISEQTIYVRVKNLNGCINNPTSFKIIVNPIPSISTTITAFPVCDVVTPSDGDPRNRIAQNINLTSKNDEILAGKPDHIVKYYLTKYDADDDNEIGNLTDFENDPLLTSFPANFNSDDPATQTIFVKVFDLGGNKCSSIFSTFQLVIYPEPNIPLNISDYTDCDNTTDVDADDENGRNGDITLKNKIPEILKNYSSTEFADFSVRFYATPLDAEIGDLDTALDENIFENDENGQEIFVRVENIKNSPIVCVNTRLSFKINIKPLPSFFVIGEENIDDPQIVCLNNTPLILEAESPDAIYDYQWTNEAGEIIGSDRTLGVTTAGKYTVTASDILPNGCSRSRTIVVKESNIATLEESFITIIDEATNIGNTDNISVSIDIISNNLGPGEYQFAITNEDTGKRYPFSGFQDEPIFENLEGGIYTITVNDKNGCAPDTELQISVIQFPKFFTPNGDGKNDVWSVKGANKIFYPNSSIDIFNRFGKLVAQIPIDSQGWDGTYNGTKLSSDDYWFRVQLIPANTSKVPVNKKGHFSLLRR